MPDDPISTDTDDNSEDPESTDGVRIWATIGLTRVSDYMCIVHYHILFQGAY